MALPKKQINPDDLAALVKLAQYPEWEVFCRLSENRVQKDKHAIIAYPEEDPQKLAIRKAFYRGRISAIYLLRKEVNNAGQALEALEEK